MRTRNGSALAFALLLLIVLDCVVLGTIHLSLQEHRIGANRALLLRLRLEAESAIRRASGYWSAAIDTMPTGPAARLRIDAAGSPITTVHVERLASRLFLLDAQTAEPPPRAGRYATRLLVHPPPLPPDVDPATAAISIATSIHIAATGAIETAAACPASGPAHAVLLASGATLTADYGHTIDATVGAMGSRSVLGEIDRITALSALKDSMSLAGDTVLGAPATGILLTRGDVRIPAGSSFRGLLIAGGRLVVDAGGAIHGAAHAGSALIAGTVQWDGCIVRELVTASGLDRPSPFPGRSWIASF